MVKTYESAEAFLQETKELLLKREAISQLLLGNAAGGNGRKCSPEFLFGTVWEEDRMILAFGNCHPWNLIIHSVMPETQKADGGTEGPALAEQGVESIAAACRELAVFLKEQKVPLNGINANGIVCRHFLTHYYDGKRFARKHLSMDIMECRRLKEIALQEGVYRPASLDDLDWVLENSIAFEKEALGDAGDPQSMRESILKDLNGEKVHRLFCLLDKTPVCMAKQTLRRLENGACITEVYTKPEYRGKGYAQTLIHKMCEEYFSRGNSFVTLFVDKSNPISNRVYEKVGFEILEDNYDYRFVEDSGL